MILKEKENTGADIEVLERLLRDPRADSRIRREIEEDIRKLKSGERGEANAAYELRVHFGDSENWLVIHDLRIEHDGLIAQIDHVLIGRMLDIWVCESKNFAGGVKINELGEFVTFFNGKPSGVASPIEQNYRHMLILRKLFESGQIALPKRLGFEIRPKFRSLVLISNGAIARPKTAVRGIESVIKTEHVRHRVTRADEHVSTLQLAKLVSFETLQDIGRQLVALHRPITFNWEARLGMNARASVHDAASAKTQPHSAIVTANAELLKAKPAAKCDACGVSVSSGVRSYCLTNAQRFGGAIYCMPCQATLANQAKD